MAETITVTVTDSDETITVTLDEAARGPAGPAGSGITSYVDEIESLSDYPDTFPPDISAIADGALSIAKTNGLQTALDGKQATLISGTNIKTVNGSSLLGSGNIEVSSIFSLSGKNFVVAGDSKSASTSATSGAGNDWPTQFSGLPVASGATVFNYAVNGRTLSTIIAQYATEGYTKRPAATGVDAFYSIRTGSNDLSSDMSTFWTNLSGHYATLRTDGFKIIAWTITPRSGQTAAINAEIRRINNLIRSSSHLWDYLIEAEASLPNPSDTVFYSDGLHETAVGNRVHAYLVQATLRGDAMPSAMLGTMAYQAFDSVSISGGTINGTTIGATTASSGVFTTIAASGTANLSGGFTTGASGTGYVGGAFSTGGNITAGASGTVQGAKLRSTGGIVSAITTTPKTANYNALAASDSTILVNATSGAITIYLPVAAGNTGQTFTIKKVDSSGNAVILNSFVGDLFDGASTLSLTTQWSAVTVQSDNDNWLVIAKVP